MEGGTAHGWERSTEQLVCLWGASTPVYKGGGEGRGRPSLWRALGSPTPTGSRIPLFLVELGALPSSRSRREGKGKEKRRKEVVQPFP